MIKKERAIGAVRSLVNDGIAKIPAAERKDRTVLESLAVDVADTAILLHRERIAAGLRRAGLDVSDTEDITFDKILDMVSKKSGYDVREFSSDGFKDAVLSQLSTDISEKLGVKVNLKNGLQAAIDGAVEDAIKNGRVNALVPENVHAGLRRLSLAKRAGVSVDVVERIEHAKKQAAWRKEHGNGEWVAV